MLTRATTGSDANVTARPWTASQLDAADGIAFRYTNLSRGMRIELCASRRGRNQEGNYTEANTSPVIERITRIADKSSTE